MVNVIKLKLTVCVLALVALSGCLGSEGGDGAIMPVANGFSVNERVYRSEWHDGTPLSSLFYGDLKNNLSYGYYEDGSFAVLETPKQSSNNLKRFEWADYAPIGNSGNYFQKSCLKDVMTDKRVCQIYVGSKIRISTNGNKPYQLCIRGHDYPEITALLRIDGASPISLGESGCSRNRSIINAALDAKVIAVQYGSWPNCTKCKSEETIRGNEEFKRLNDFLPF